MAKTEIIKGIKYLLDDNAQTAEVIANNYIDEEITIFEKVKDNKYTVTSIGQSAFRDCTSLKSITIPDSVTSIEDGAFSNCGALTSVTIPDSVTSIGDGAFSNCSALTSVTIGNSVTSIGDAAFSGCSSLPVEDNLLYADTYLVVAVDKKLSTYSIKAGTKWIGSTAFSDCSSLESITIPDSVTSIGDAAFSNCGALTSVTIGNSVTSIGQSAFRNCKQLNSITIPNSVTNIGYWAFAHCDQLAEVIIGHKFTGIGDVFDGGVTNDGTRRPRPGDKSKNSGRPLEETERKKRNEPIIKAIELFLNALDSSGNKKPHDYEYLLGQTIRQYEPAENHQHVSVGAWKCWQDQAHNDEDIRQFQYTWKYKKKQPGQSEKFNTLFIQEHTTPVADIKKDLKKKNNICFKSIEDSLEKMHISRILKTEDKAIKNKRYRGLKFEEIANSTVCYLGAGIEFQCSEDKIGYEAFNECNNLQILKIGGKFICRTKIDKLIEGEKITI